MKKDKITQIRLSKYERAFLTMKGLGKMASGLRRIMIEAGYEEFLKSIEKVESKNKEERK